MNLNLFTVFIIICATLFLPSKLLAQQEKECSQTDKVHFKPNDIFNLEDDDSIFIHDWANFLHIKTKQDTLENEAAFFLKKCEVNYDDLLELERHLRNQKYIRDAKVKYDENNLVSVETWDNWTLLPTIDFSRKGGKNKFAIGIRDRNLLGLGIGAEIEYFSNEQRTGYRLDTQFPLYLKNNINASITLTSNDDGSSKAAFINKQFVSFDTQYAYQIGFDNFSQIDTQFELGQQSNRFSHEQRFSTIAWQWLQTNSSTDTLRFGVGYTRESHRFSDLIKNALNETNLLPNDREFNYPFVSIEYLQKDFRKLTNLHLINHIEDYNLGWHVSASIGTDFSDRDNAPSLIWQSNLSKGIEISENALVYFDVSLEGEQYNNSQQQDRVLLKTSAEYFYKFNQHWGAYFKNANVISDNQYLDSPVVLGGETGVRGYPLQYQHATKSTQFTAEARYYPQINIYKLLELGGAAFIDSGKVFDQSESSEKQSSLMTSVGLGARFYSTRTSEARVIHIDVIKPISSDPNVNSVEFRVTTKHRF
ncbi:hypothetical protein [Aliiglaciecola lipolytica]|uniref:hypothetical protein n=1 Tax=Aliiglaciecola lipolytica TaxID=477689 RepID=UPI001C0815CE|nr:hypothetical protein [Aliiglaciecola lipolytica]MBU2878141.1 hypothetical protein [Aliiglaciecola lipolytica]